MPDPGPGCALDLQDKVVVGRAHTRDQVGQGDHLSITVFTGSCNLVLPPFNQWTLSAAFSSEE